MLPQLTKRDAAKTILKPFTRLAVKELWPCRKLFSYRGVNSANCSIVSHRLFRNGSSVKGFPNLYPVLPENQSFDTRMLWIGLRVNPDWRLEMSKLSHTERFMTLFSGYTKAHGTYDARKLGSPGKQKPTHRKK